MCFFFCFAGRFGQVQPQRVLEPDVPAEKCFEGGRVLQAVPHPQAPPQAAVRQPSEVQVKRRCARTHTRLTD